MPVTQQTPYNAHAANGVSTVFAYTFRVLLQSDLFVSVDGVVQVGGFTVSGVGANNGGTVTFGAPPANGAAVEIFRDIPLTRQTDYQANGDLLEETLDADFDRIWMRLQDSDARLASAIRVPLGEELEALPDGTTRANTVLAFDANGAPTLLPGGPDPDTLLALQLGVQGNPAQGAGLVGFRSGWTVYEALTDLYLTNVSINDPQFAGGAVPDFNPATGVGTDNRLAIQAAFDYAVALGNARLTGRPGNYFLGAGIDGARWAQVELGTYTGTGPQNVVFDAAGVVFYPGRAGRALAIHKANRCEVRGLKMVGYTGGALGTSRQNDALITVNYSSSNVTLDGVYLTNCLGDCVYAGGTLVAGGGTGSETRFLTVRNSVLKTRHGDGLESSAGGTKSRTAIALIDVIGCDIRGNTILGQIDLEPNLNSQHVVNVSIRNNSFPAGNVTAQAAIGTAYWHDEPMNSSGGTVIQSSITLQGTPAAPIVAGNVVENNTFDRARIFAYNVYKLDRIADNVFQQGLIEIGSTSGANNTTGATCDSNTAFDTLSGETTFVKLSGFLTYSTVRDNILRKAGCYCVANTGGSTGDNGRNIFTGNKNIDAGAAGDMNFSPQKTSFAEEENIDFSAGVALVGAGTAGAQAFTVRSARFSRGGTQVTFSIQLTWAAKDGTAAGQVKVTGLPFTGNGSAGDDQYFDVITSGGNVVTAGKTLKALLASGTSELLLYEMGSGAALAAYTWASIGANSTIAITGAYRI